MQKSKTAAYFRLLVSISLILRREWATFVRVMGPTCLVIVPLSIMFGFVIAPFIVLGRNYDSNDVLIALKWGGIIGIAFGATLALVAHTVYVLGFYGKIIFNLYRGKLWGAEDLRKLRALTEALEREPIFPSWVYLLQLRF